MRVGTGGARARRPYATADSDLTAAESGACCAGRAPDKPGAAAGKASGALAGERETGGAMLESLTPEHRQYVRVAACVIGIVGTLVIYGILQERIMTRPYGVGEEEEPEHFKYSVFLVLNNRLMSMSVAAAVLLVRRTGMKPAAPILSFAAVSVSNVIATTCQYEALRYVSFPVQTLAKCAKMIPVMIWGRIISGKRYTVSDYLVALTVMAGCTIFVLFGDVTSSASKKKKASETTVFGVGLMAGYLGFDGFTSTFQDKLFKGYNMETYNQMLWVTACSATISLFWLFTDASLVDAFAFVQRHPEVMSDIFILSLSSTCGQLIILYTIKEFGALLFATVMTTRQFISILLSSLIFFHPLTGPQWAGTLAVFAALYYKAFAGKAKHAAKPAAEEATSLLDEEKQTLPMSTNPGR